MTDVTPLVQPPIEDIRNAAMIADSWASLPTLRKDPDMIRAALQDIGRLLKHALAQLGEPTAETVSEALVLMRCLSAFGSLNAPSVTEREARDIASAILNQQLRGAPPPQSRGDQ